MNKFEDKYKKKVLETLKYTIGFCEKYDLRYYMAYGSAIGAVRHHNIIPWDDDVDIYMLREDYNKMLHLRSEMKGSGFDLVFLEDRGYYLKYAKVVNKNTTLWEFKEYPFIIGAFVDIFPLDCTNWGMQKICHTWLKYDRLWEKYHIMQKYHPLKDSIKLLIEKHPKAFLYWIFGKYLRRHQNEVLREVLKFEKTLNCQSGEYYVSYTESGPYIFQKKWFDDHVIMPFADLQVRLPSGYHEYLTYMYGDYMKLPPKEQQFTNHKRYYINLKEGLTLNKVRKRIKKGEHRIY